MLPKKEINIYPKSVENLNALISFYFDKYDVDRTECIETLLNITTLSLNQIEFIIRKLSESYEIIFRKNLKGTITLKNLISYGIESLTLNEVDYKGSQARIMIMKLFNDFVKHTEVDIDYLEKNN